MVKIKGSVWYTIYHHLPIVKGVCYTPLLINQPMGKGHLCQQQHRSTPLFDREKNGIFHVICITSNSLRYLGIQGVANDAGVAGVPPKGWNCSVIRNC